jgi:TusA-related sulfurtransferase
MKYGAYLQVYKDDGNMVETVRSMNNNMPDCEIVVVSDGGDNFEKYKKAVKEFYKEVQDLL